VLSQANLGDPVAAAVAGERVCDGLLTASEIVREWRIDADLVVLSACETGLGREVMGEGYLGLANAFLRAGARSLVVSLWRVEDQSTALLMERFHANRRGAGAAPDALPAAEALREAKRWLRTWTDDAGRTPYAHPYYWSAFILIGAR
jgi:CHAT domain-containing protein